MPKRNYTYVTQVQVLRSASANDPYDFAENYMWGGLQAVVREPGSAMS